MAAQQRIKFLDKAQMRNDAYKNGAKILFAEFPLCLDAYKMASLKDMRTGVNSRAGGWNFPLNTLAASSYAKLMGSLHIPIGPCRPPRCPIQTTGSPMWNFAERQRRIVCGLPLYD